MAALIPRALAFGSLGAGLPVVCLAAAAGSVLGADTAWHLRLRRRHHLLDRVLPLEHWLAPRWWHSPHRPLERIR